MKNIFLPLLLAFGLAGEARAISLSQSDIAIFATEDLRPLDNTWTGYNTFEALVNLSSTTTALDMVITTATVSSLSVSSATISTLTVTDLLSLGGAAFEASTGSFTDFLSVGTSSTDFNGEGAAFIARAGFDESAAIFAGFGIQDALEVFAEAGSVGLVGRTDGNLEFDVRSIAGATQGTFGMTQAGKFFINDAAINATNIVPSGMIVMSTAACPSGWTEYTGAQGRYLMGLPIGGTVAGTTGAPLGDLDVAGHDHMVTPATVIVQSGAGSSVGDDIAVTSTAVARDEIAPVFQMRLCVVP